MGPRELTSLRRSILGIALFVGAVVLVSGFWADRRGYISIFGGACTDQGFDPVPSYDELVEQYGLSPYCARQQRGETWF